MLPARPRSRSWALVLVYVISATSISASSCARDLDPTREPREVRKNSNSLAGGIINDDHGCKSLAWLSLVAFLEALKLEADTEA